LWLWFNIVEDLAELGFLCHERREYLVALFIRVSDCLFAQSSDIASERGLEPWIEVLIWIYSFDCWKGCLRFRWSCRAWTCYLVLNRGLNILRRWRDFDGGLQIVLRRLL
jgi:hypothetical protein